MAGKTPRKQSRKLADKFSSECPITGLQFVYAACTFLSLLAAVTYAGFPFPQASCWMNIFVCCSTGSWKQCPFMRAIVISLVSVFVVLLLRFSPKLVRCYIKALKGSSASHKKGNPKECPVVRTLVLTALAVSLGFVWTNQVKLSDSYDVCFWKLVVVSTVSILYGLVWVAMPRWWVEA